MLAVNSGDTRCGVGDAPDPMLMFRDVADLIISHEFLLDRGGVCDGISVNKTNIEKFSSYSDSDQAKLGLTTATSDKPSESNIIGLASTLLLSGAPIIYYGTETGFRVQYQLDNRDYIYPKKEGYNNIDGHLALNSHIPMPWDSTGKRFSPTVDDTTLSGYFNAYEQLSSVETQLAEGNDQSTLRLVMKLVDLRQKPSMERGTMER
ncbi:unnamed protein product [Schistosoma turkestanicum]|nr:unnamed protein product [Schistosoma turkestanicum]